MFFWSVFQFPRVLGYVTWFSISEMNYVVALKKKSSTIAAAPASAGHETLPRLGVLAAQKNKTWALCAKNLEGVMRWARPISPRGIS